VSAASTGGPHAVKAEGEGQGARVETQKQGRLGGWRHRWHLRRGRGSDVKRGGCGGSGDNDIKGGG
jgi:hypothetical protein